MKRIIFLVTFCSFVLAFLFIIGCGVTTTNGTVYYTLTITVTGEAVGSVEATPSGTFVTHEASIVYPAGTLVTLEAIPDGDFDGWSYALTGFTNPATLEMDASKSVEATFSPP